MEFTNETALASSMWRASYTATIFAAVTPFATAAFAAALVANMSASATQASWLPSKPAASYGVASSAASSVTSGADGGELRVVARETGGFFLRWCINGTSLRVVSAPLIPFIGSRWAELEMVERPWR